MSASPPEMAPAKRRIGTGSDMERDFAYSRAVVSGDWCFVAGTTGYDYATMAMPRDAGAQARSALATIRRSLAEAGFAMSDVVRARYVVTDRDAAAALAPALREAFGAAPPAATLVVADLLDPAMKVEIEVTAHRS